MSIDSQGVEYKNNQYKTLILAPVGLISYTVLPSCEEIVGGASSENSPFKLCSRTFEKINFEKDCAITKIGKFAFSGLEALNSVDFSNCKNLKLLEKSLFMNSKKLGTLIFPPNVETISESCFFGCSSLGSLDVPDSLKSIGYHSFRDSGTTELFISENSNIDDLSSECFYGTKLKSFFIAKNVSRLDGSIFIHSDSLTDLTFHKDNKNFNYVSKTVYSKDNTELILTFATGVLRVPSNVTTFCYACLRARAITEVIFEGTSLTTFSKWCMAETSVTEFTFPRGLAIIDDNAFAYTSTLTTVHLTDDITTIRNRAFYTCSALTTIDLLNVKTIHDSAFAGCTSLETIKIPKSVTRIGVGAFSFCSKLQTIDCTENDNFLFENGMFFIENKATLGEFFGTQTDVVIPKNCKKIGKTTFATKNIRSVTFNGVTELSIGERAFQGSKLEEITLPGCLSSIGINCFYKCSNLHTVNFSECTLTVIPTECFFECTKLVTLNLPSTITTIEESAFIYCTRLANLDLSVAAIETIGNKAFLECGIQTCKFNAALLAIGINSFQNSGVTTVDFSQTEISIISQSSFSDCHKLSSITFSRFTDTIDTLAFSNCEELTSITLPLHIRYVGASAFEGCLKLATVELTPNCSLQSIKGRAFNNCPSLTKIVVDENDFNFTFQQGALMSYNLSNFIFFLPTSSVTMYVVPAHVETIGAYAFDGCTNVKMIVIPEGNIKTINYRSFADCTKLSFIYLPASITMVSEHAFINCPKLKACGSVQTSRPDELVESNLIQNLKKAGIDPIAFSNDCPAVKTCAIVHRYSPAHITALILLPLFLS